VPHLPDQPAPHPIVSFVRALVGPAIVITGWQLMATSCAWGAAIVYFGFLLSLAEWIWEPALLQRPYQIQIALIGIVFSLAAAFTIGVASAPAPVKFKSFETNIDYTGANAPAGITWNPFFTELDFIVTNPTDENYDNVDLLVRPDFPIAKIAQMSNLQGVSFEDRYGVNMRAKIEEIGKQSPVPVEFLATDAGYKVHCGSIPPNSSLSLVMAIVDFKKALPPDPSKPVVIPSGEDLSHFTIPVTIKNNDGTFTYWFGRVNERRYLPKPTPTKVYVEISYTANHCRKHKTLEQPVDRWNLP
jgi:hypothetical protein